MTKFLLGFLAGFSLLLAVCIYSIDNPIYNYSVWTPAQHEELRQLLMAVLSKLQRCNSI